MEGERWKVEGGGRRVTGKGKKWEMEGRGSRM